jgi:hypothetical protein
MDGIDFMPGGVMQAGRGGWWVRKGWIAAAAAVVALLAACDAQRIEKLEEGVATEADVRRQFGAPHAVEARPDGSKMLEYTRQPEGSTNYRIVIGADGKMSSLRQLLTPANVARVQPGMNKLEVMELLGQVASSKAWELKGEEDWSWRYRDGSEPRHFTVTFNRDGQVLRAGHTEDPRATAGTR